LVPHDGILTKIAETGVDFRVVVWIQEFLSGRSERVRVDGHLSEEVRVTLGVPQGSVLGPLLFLAYVNDIWRDTDPNVRLFAHHCIIYKKILDSSDTGKLQMDLDKLREWAIVNEIKINPDKSTEVSSTRARVKVRLTYYFGDQLILEVTRNNHTERFKMGRSCKLYATKSMEGSSFNNVYNETGQ
jgi:hypothetical protein